MTAGDQISCGVLKVGRAGVPLGFGCLGLAVPDALTLGGRSSEV